MSIKDKHEEELFEDDTKTIDDLNLDLEEESTEINPATEFDLLKENLDREKDKYLRLFAEFENYKKRTGKERMEMYRTAGQEVITAMLPVMDDFDRALAEIKKSDDDGLYKGVLLIKNKLQETLTNKGLEDMKVEKGDIFNADKHEAVTQIPAPSANLKGKIIDVLEKGYILGDKIIRFPKVIIGQ